MKRAGFALTFGCLALACGAAASKPKTTGPAASSTAPVTPSTPASLASLGPLPPMAFVPPPGVRGSKVVEKKAVAALSTCSAPGTRKDPAAGLTERTRACGAHAKLSAKSAVFTGDVADADMSRSHTFRAEAGKCYRVYFASDATDVVVGLRDAAGDDASESPTGAVPSDGLLCWKSAGDVSIHVATGTGHGKYALQVFGD